MRGFRKFPSEGFRKFPSEGFRKFPDSGEINPQSEWVKVCCGERAYYVQRRDAISLAAPAEGVIRELDADTHKFDGVWLLLSGASSISITELHPSPEITARPWLPDGGRSRPSRLRLTKVQAAHCRLALAYCLRPTAANDDGKRISLCKVADDLIERIGLHLVGQEEGVRGLLDHLGLLAKEEIVMRHLEDGRGRGSHLETFSRRSSPPSRAEQPLAQLGGLRELLFEYSGAYSGTSGRSKLFTDLGLPDVDVRDWTYVHGDAQQGPFSLWQMHKWYTAGRCTESQYGHPIDAAQRGSHPIVGATRFQCSSDGARDFVNLADCADIVSPTGEVAVALRLCSVIATIVSPALTHFSFPPHISLAQFL